MSGCKRCGGYALLWLHLLVVATAAGAQPPEITFYVASNGNDLWSGRGAEPDGNDGPFATVKCAQAAVRRALERDRRTPVRVYLRSGTYVLETSLEFGPADSGTPNAPVIYSSFSGERAVLSGGRPLPLGNWHEVNGRRVWTIDASSLTGSQH